MTVRMEKNIFFLFSPSSVSLRTIDHFYFRLLLSLSPDFSKTDEEGHLLRTKWKEQAEVRIKMGSLLWRYIH